MQKYLPIFIFLINLKLLTFIIFQTNVYSKIPKEKKNYKKVIQLQNYEKSAGIIMSDMEKGILVHSHKKSGTRMYSWDFRSR